MKPTAKKNFKLTGEYSSSVAAYGKPPQGFRFLKEGEKSDPKTDWVWRESESGWIQVTFPQEICSYHVLFIRRLPEDAPVEDSAPPKYTGREISWGDSLDVGVAKAGKAPKGWEYVLVDEKVGSGDYILSKDHWEAVGARYSHKIGNGLGAGSWPVIRRAPLKVAKPAAPKVTIKSLLARIEALEKKLGEKVTLTFGG